MKAFRKTIHKQIILGNRSSTNQVLKVVVVAMEAIVDTLVAKTAMMIVVQPLK